MNHNQLLDWCKDAHNHHDIYYVEVSSYNDRHIKFNPRGSYTYNVFFKQLIKYLWKKVFNTELESDEEIEHEGINLLYYLFTSRYASSDLCISSVYGNTSAIDDVDIYERGMLRHIVINTDEKYFSVLKIYAFAVDCKVGQGIDARFVRCINCSISRLSPNLPRADRMNDYYPAKNAVVKLFNCFNCVDCINCSSCSDCLQCTACIRVYNSIMCEDCKECMWCNNCKDCKKLKVCDNCTECNQSRGLDTCQRCRNHCNNCTGCIDCKVCTNCNACDSCNNCDDTEMCVKCKGCKDACINCVECTDCVKCTYCKECKKCTNCVDCTECKTCTSCTTCVTCVKQTSKKQTDSALYSRSHQNIKEEKMFFKHPFIVDLDDDGQRVEINGRIIQYFDDENNLVFQGTCQYACPVANWDNALDFKLGQGWIYYPDIQRKCCYIILSTNSKYNVTLSDLIKIHDTDVLVEYIQKQSKHSKNSVVYVYDRNGNEVYKSMKF